MRVKTESTDGRLTYNHRCEPDNPAHWTNKKNIEIHKTSHLLRELDTCACHMCFFPCVSVFSPSSVFSARQISFGIVSSVSVNQRSSRTTQIQLVDIVVVRQPDRLKSEMKSENVRERMQRRKEAMHKHTHTHIQQHILAKRKLSVVYFVLAQTLNGRISPEF